MSRWCRIVAVVALVALSAGDAVAEICDVKFTVKDKSYVQLGAVSKLWPGPLGRVFVWVDDITSNFWTGAYYPFQMYVLIGNVYAPFSAKSGALNRTDFLRLSDPRDVNNDRRGPLQVPRALKRELKFPVFNVGKQEFWLLLEAVRSSRGGDDKVDLAVCRY